jgi:four helix bundle protein
MKTENIILHKSFKFALDTIQLCRMLQTQNEFVISKQLLRAGTSVGANVREAQNAESRKDFTHKLSISQKECDESMYWLELLFHSGQISRIEFDVLNNEAQQILKIIKSIIISTNQKKLA